MSDETPHATMGFFTDVTLCIGCKACEVACKQWNELPSDGYKLSGNSYDNTNRLGASTWRHVAFVEQMDRVEPDLSRWMMMSDVCKHCTNAGCLEACPTGAIVRNEFDDVYVQPDICNGCGKARRGFARARAVGADLRYRRADGRGRQPQRVFRSARPARGLQPAAESGVALHLSAGRLYESRRCDRRDGAGLVRDLW